MCRASSTAIFGHVTERYDVIIVGSGAGGGTLAHTLAPSGKRILLLERGNFLPREIENWDPGPVFVDGRYISPDPWYDADSMDVPVAGVAHQAGTCRFGTDPASSVLDVNCQAHEVDNLYVVDTSFFLTTEDVNPALTARPTRSGSRPSAEPDGVTGPGHDLRKEAKCRTFLS